MRSVVGLDPNATSSTAKRAASPREPGLKSLSGKDRPSSLSATDSESFRRLERSIRSVNRDAIVAPYLVVVVTDSRYFSGLTANVFRFLPVRLTQPDLARMHGIDERLGVRDYEQAIRTYRQLMIDAASR